LKEGKQGNQKKKFYLHKKQDVTITMNKFEIKCNLYNLKPTGYDPSLWVTLKIHNINLLYNKLTANGHKLTLSISPCYLNGELSLLVLICTLGEFNEAQ